jgi:N-acetylglucosamine-6-phosphate deacetylase
LLDGLRLTTIAPELPGALELIAWLRGRGIATSMGHSAANLDEARAGFAAGGSSTTHLFNAMSGVDHHAPGLAVAALVDDSIYVELIADGQHVHPALWSIITRTKPTDRLMLVSDSISLAGVGDGRTTIGGLAVEVVGRRVTLAGTTTLAGSVIALDTAVRMLVESGVPLPFAVAAASRNPLAMLGVTDRGRIAVGQRADLVELDEALDVQRVMRAGSWLQT